MYTLKLVTKKAIYLVVTDYGVKLSYTVSMMHHTYSPATAAFGIATGT